MSSLLISLNFAPELRVLLPLLPSGGTVPAAAARSPRGRQGQGLTNTLNIFGSDRGSTNANMCSSIRSSSPSFSLLYLSSSLLTLFISISALSLTFLLALPQLFSLSLSEL